MVSDTTASSKVSLDGSQYARERLRKVAAVQRFAQYLIHTDFGRAGRKLRATVTAHQDDWNSGPKPPDFVRQFGADEIRHQLIGEYGIEPLWRGPKCLQCRAARIEAHWVVAKPGDYFFGERNQRALIVDNHHGFTGSA